MAGGEPRSTNDVLTTTTAESSTTSSTDSATTTTAPATTTTTTLLQGNWASVPVVTAFGWIGILGWWDGDEWVPHSESNTLPLVGNEDFQLLYLDNVDRLRSTGLASTCEWLGEWIRTPTVPPGFWSDRSGVIVAGERCPIVGVSTSERIVVDGIETLASDNAHVGFAAEFLTELGLQVERPIVKQIVRVDLDGDGVDEKLVVAEDFDITFEGETEGYSVVFLRSVAAGNVETTDVESIYVTPGEIMLGTHQAVTTVADLNGDGVREVVIAAHSYESEWMVVYEFRGGTLTPVLSGGCGV